MCVSETCSAGRDCFVNICTKYFFFNVNYLFSRERERARAGERRRRGRQRTQSRLHAHSRESDEGLKLTNPQDPDLSQSWTLNQLNDQVSPRHFKKCVYQNISERIESIALHPPCGGIVTCYYFWPMNCDQKLQISLPCQSTQLPVSTGTAPESI